VADGLLHLLGELFLAAEAVSRLQLHDLELLALLDRSGKLWVRRPTEPKDAIVLGELKFVVAHEDFLLLCQELALVLHLVRCRFEALQEHDGELLVVLHQVLQEAFVLRLENRA